MGFPREACCCCQRAREQNRGLSVLSGVRGAADLRSAEFIVSEENILSRFSAEIQIASEATAHRQRPRSPKTGVRGSTSKKENQKNQSHLFLSKNPLRGPFLLTLRPVFSAAHSTFPLEPKAMIKKAWSGCRGSDSAVPPNFNQPSN